MKRSVSSKFDRMFSNIAKFSPFEARKYFRLRLSEMLGTIGLDNFSSPACHLSFSLKCAFVMITAILLNARHQRFSLLTPKCSLELSVIKQSLLVLKNFTALLICLTEIFEGSTPRKNFIKAKCSLNIPIFAKFHPCF